MSRFAGHFYVHNGCHASRDILILQIPAEGGGLSADRRKQMDTVKVWEQKVVIPTYEIGEAEKNPVFLDRLVYQGSC